ncbi:hypothetical protein BU25DRAFT_325588, partial [Macroventuria anomochaeta]
TMSTRNLLRHIFRHSPRDRVTEDALPLGLRKSAPELSGVATDSEREPAVSKIKQSATSSTTTLPPKTPEPFGLEDIAEEDIVDIPSPIETASLAETLASLDLEISTFSTRELVHATLDEAKTAASSHLDTINTTLALLGALDGFSATISALRREMLEKKQACEEKMVMLDAVERAVE